MFGTGQICLDFVILCKGSKISCNAFVHHVEGTIECQFMLRVVRLRGRRLAVLKFMGF
jgi:hypothetical protein